MDAGMGGVGAEEALIRDWGRGGLRGRALVDRGFELRRERGERAGSW